MDREFYYYRHNDRVDWENIKPIIEEKKKHPKFN